MHNEAASVASLVAEILAACSPVGRFELIIVDDASTDETAAKVLSLMRGYPWLRLVRHDRQAGQSAAIHVVCRRREARLCACWTETVKTRRTTFHLCLRPSLRPAPSTQLGLVAGQRVGRQDTLAKRLSSRFANRLRAYILKDRTRDTGCGLKAFRRDAYLALPFFNHQHRYLPALFSRDGWQIAHVDVVHRARMHGRSHYTNIGRAIVGIHDLIGVAWLLRRRKSARWSETLPEGEAH